MISTFDHTFLFGKFLGLKIFHPKTHPQYAFKDTEGGGGDLPDINIV